MQYIIMCRSLTYAQRAVRVLESSGIHGGLTKAPQGVTPEGCTFGVRVNEKHMPKAVAVVSSAGIKVGKVFRVSDDGKAAEVKM